MRVIVTQAAVGESNEALQSPSFRAMVQHYVGSQPCVYPSICAHLCGLTDRTIAASAHQSDLTGCAVATSAHSSEHEYEVVDADKTGQSISLLLSGNMCAE